MTCALSVMHSPLLLLGLRCSSISSRIRRRRRRSPSSRSGPTSIMPASLGAIATTNIWFGVGAPAERFVIPRADEPSARRRICGRRPASRPSCARAGEQAYREWNFAPSGDWAAYDFTALSRGHGPTPRSTAALHPDRRTISPGGRWARRSPSTPTANWELGLSAVLEEKDGTKSYWALAHPRRQARFPRPGCFAAQLP